MGLLFCTIYQFGNQCAIYLVRISSFLLQKITAWPLGLALSLLRFVFDFCFFLFAFVFFFFFLLLLCFAAHSPDNSFMGFAVPQKQRSSSMNGQKNRKHALVYGKLPEFWLV